MVKVKLFKKTDYYFKIIISGHSFYDVKNDIVCAGISAIIFGFANAISELIPKNDYSIIKANNSFKFIAKNMNDNLQLLLDALVINLQTISAKYSKNIIIISN